MYSFKLSELKICHPAITLMEMVIEKQVDLGI